MTQMQASPGASVQAQPISAPGPMQATGGAGAPGMTQADIKRLLEAERRAVTAEQAAVEAERRQAQAAEDARRAAEFQELKRQYASRDALQAEQQAQWRAAEDERQRTEEARRAEAAADAQAAEMARAEAAQAAAFAPGAPSPVMPPMFAQEVTTAAAPIDLPPEKKGNLLPIILAAAGVGLFVMTRGKKRGRKR